MRHLNQWVIYDHPKDYPDNFVVRRWEVSPGRCQPTEDVSLHVTLEESRKSIPNWTYRIPRFEEDDPTIVEVWL